MSIKRNWIIYLSLIIYLAASLLILIFGMEQFNDTVPYPYLTKFTIVVGCFAIYIILNIIFYLLTRPILIKLFSRIAKIQVVAEIPIVLLILAGGIALRVYYIRTYPVAMESDYKFYYDVAIMIKDNTLTTLSNNEYISLFPHTYGYAYILSIAMRIFGTGPATCLYLNVGFSALTALFCYGIGKKVAGSIAGISALTLSIFWPSQILFSNINGAEAAFTCFLYGAAFIAIMLMRMDTTSKVGSFLMVVLHILCGVFIALSSAIRPMGLILLIALVICLLSMNRKLEYKDVNELSFRKIFLSKGFLRAAMVLLGYFICTQLVSAGISNAIEKDIASGGAMGYSLMVGLDMESDGGYSEESMNFLYDSYDKTKSANAANAACMERAMEEVKANPMGILELMAKKFYLIWSNDDYATTTNIVTMNNQGLLSPEREEMFYSFAEYNQIFYLVMVFLSAIGAIFMMKKDNNASIFAIFFIGTVALFLLVEMQNRYHYFALQSIVILAAYAVGSIFDQYKMRSLERIHYKASDSLVENTVNPMVKGTSEEEEQENGLEKQKSGIAEQTIGLDEQKEMVYTMDVQKAIEEGHIRITATEAYRDELWEELLQYKEQNSSPLKDEQEKPHSQDDGDTQEKF